MNRIGVLSVVLENPQNTNQLFNDLVAEFQHIIRGRMGIPFLEEGVSVVSLTVLGEMDEINNLTGKLGNLKDVTVKAAISKKEL